MAGKKAFPLLFSGDGADDDDEDVEHLRQFAGCNLHSVMVNPRETTYDFLYDALYSTATTEEFMVRFYHFGHLQWAPLPNDPTIALICLQPITPARTDSYAGARDYHN
jgi:hypothetical protein